MTPVIVNFRTAPVSAGAIDLNGQVFVASKVGGDLTKTTIVRSLADFEAAYSTRTGGAVACWDWLDAYFKEGGKQAVIGSYATTGAWASAFTLMDAKQGPGQLVVVGEPPTSALGTDMANEAAAKNRFTVPDVASGSTLADMETLGDGLPVTGIAAESYMLVGPWLNYPPPAGVTGGTARPIPASALACAIMARVTADGNPNRAPGGRDYLAQYADSVTLDTSDSQRDTALTHKVNLVRLVNNVLQIDSAQTGIVQDPSTPFWQANCSRARMWAKDQAKAIGSNYYMRNIDAEGHLAGGLKGQLVGMLKDLYDVDGLYGATPADAFDVNVGVQVNNPVTASAATLTAVAQMKLSLYAKTVEVDLVAVPILGNVIQS